MEDIKTTDVSAGYLESVLYNLEPESRPFDPQLSGHLLAELWGTEVFFRMVCDFESSSGNVRELQESDIAEQQVDSFEKFRISRGIPAFPSGSRRHTIRLRRVFTISLAGRRDAT